VTDGPTIPEEHGGVLIDPPLEAWPQLAKENASRMRAAAATSLAGEDLGSLRARARGEANEAARAYSTALGLPIDADRFDPDDLLFMTGHQPLLFHPGVWAKHLALDAAAAAAGATAIDLVVDSDGFETVGLRAPCMEPAASRCEVVLAAAGPSGYFAGTRAPTSAEIGTFCEEASGLLATLPASAPGEHFAAFCADLSAACSAHADLGAALTCARRRYEAVLGTGYLELSVVAQSEGTAFLAFASELALRAEEVARVQNEELASYRERHAVRSAARPFPSLGERDGSWELPLWYLDGPERRSLWARPTGEGVELVADGRVVAELPGEPAAAAAHLVAERAPLAPKALTLTMFNRLLVADLFVHGVGGAKYERVTDRVAERLFGTTPPPFAVATMTLELELGTEPVSPAELRRAEQLVHELSHNPDRHIERIASDDPARAEEARGLAAEKARLVREISAEGADKKALGARIREVNDRLSSLAGPLVAAAEMELAQLRAAREAEEVLRDRTYPFCLWDPSDVRGRLL
jgi:hypothetical protein